MDFIDQLKVLGERVEKLKNQIQTEEATKNAFIMPFIQMLGYDIFNPTEVVPEFVADFGASNIEKVDYAIVKDGQPIIIIECKWHGEKIERHYTQLHKYFHFTKARFAILTNGVDYNFYTDLEMPNKLDDKPFLSFDITDVKEQIASELKKFHKSYFDISNIITTASELKYSNAIRSILANEIKSPSENFVKFFVTNVYQGRATSNVIEQFTQIVHKTINNFINDLINERLKSAITQNTKSMEEQITEESKELSEKPKSSRINTTIEELEAYSIVKSILRTKVDASRITYRDFQSFFSILLDDTIRQTICRLYLEDKKKYLAILDNRKEIKYELESIDELYKYQEILNNSLDCLINKKIISNESESGDLR